MVAVNSGESYLGAEIREWCSVCKERDALLIKAKYYSECSREPNDKAFYFVEKDGDRADISKYRVVRDLVKSPRL